VSFDYEDAAIAQKVVNDWPVSTSIRTPASAARRPTRTSDFLEAQLADARSRLEAQETKLKVFRERNSGRLPTQTQTNMQAIQNTQMALQAMVESLARDRDRKLMLERLYSDAAADPAASTPAAASQAVGAARAGDTASALRSPPRRSSDWKRREASLLSRKPAERQASRRDAPQATDRGPREAGGRRGASAPDLPGRGARTGRQPERPAAETGFVRCAQRSRASTGRSPSKRARSADCAERSEHIRRASRRFGNRVGVVALTRDYDTLQVTYRELLAKSENSKMAASLEQRQIGERFRLLDAPRVPLRPHSPNRLKINAIGTMAGVGPGTGAHHAGVLS